MKVSSVSFGNSVSKIDNVSRQYNTSFKQAFEPQKDSYEVTTPKELTTRDKQKIIKAANRNATGWAIFGGIFSSIYYALRSDETIAKKYNLDVNKDKDFIKTIRESQALWTMPCVIFGLGFLPYLYNVCRNENNIKV